MRYMLLLFLGLVVFIVTAISIYLSPDDLKSCEQPMAVGICSKVDAIVAVSGGDTSARAKEAIQLYKEGWSEKLIFSGAAADSSGPSNAEIMARLAFEAGVPDEAIITEELSRTTAENALNTSRFIAEQDINRIILVTSAYHQRRALLEFSTTLGPSVRVLNHPVATDKQWIGFWWWTTGGGWWLAGGELVKIMVFYSAQGESPV